MLFEKSDGVFQADLADFCDALAQSLELQNLLGQRPVWVVGEGGFRIGYRRKCDRSAP
ncbi:MAG: hypothetical protein Q7Q73_03650 [Verrucomicrobiota bacterium JB024]|nr:hypothetical protein [Verrucomicrobiota bacterium JB024]